MNGPIIAITGTPGVGKTRLSFLIKKKCGCAKVVEINKILLSHNAFSGVDESGAKIADMPRLNRAVAKELLRYSKRSCAIVLVGHLAPELKLKYDMAIVLRSSLKKLEARLEKRGYSRKKISENLIAEGLDYCGESISKKCAEVYEVETASQINWAVNRMLEICMGKRLRVKEGAAGNIRANTAIDKTGELYWMLKAGRIIQ
ncbi:MAG: AAA family ATPase [Candidatus Micrarchaeaceae archaeon]